jgi:hypothetical protein
VTGRESHTGSSDHAPGARGPNKCNGVTMAAPVEPPLKTTLKTPAGKMSAANFTRSTVINGVISDGLSTIVLPAASAAPIFQMASSRG